MRCYVYMLLITSTANIKTWERDNGLYGGLSPQARGTRALPEWGLFCTRFIPAGAGNSQPDVALRLHPAVYPRWRGELPVENTRGRNISGLSPLARGTRLASISVQYFLGFIPAGAGNSLIAPKNHSDNSVYPRWRGELTSNINPKKRGVGLSPLARGTL